MPWTPRYVLLVRGANIGQLCRQVDDAPCLSSLTNGSCQPSDVDALTDEEILRLERVELAPGRGVSRITPRTVFKSSQDVDEHILDASEANALNLVYSKTNIPVPRVHRTISRKSVIIIIMDYIPGRTLAEVWSTYSVWKKTRVAFTLRSYIRQLRRLKASPSTPPGPLSAHGPRTCDLPSIFGCIVSYRGPFASYPEFSAFFNDRCKMGLDYSDVPEVHPWRREPFDDSSPLVLSHMDLNPRNIIVGEDGRLWLIDWAWSGYYPPWFEYVAMLRQMENERAVGFEDYFWEIMIPFVCGPYFTQRRWLERIMQAFNYY